MSGAGARSGHAEDEHSEDEGSVNSGSRGIEKSPPWWQRGIRVPRWARALLVFCGIVLMLFAIWARLIAIYLAVEVRLELVGFLFAGWALLIISLGITRGCGAGFVGLSAEGFSQYYVHGNTDDGMRIVNSVIFLALGVLWLIRGNVAAHPQPELTTLHLSDRSHANHG